MIQITQKKILLESSRPKEKGQKVQGDTSKRGCTFCPLNKIPFLRKVKNLDKVIGRRIMLWAQNPGQLENARGVELIGRAGQLLWSNAAAVGLKREDCDIQNVVRCWTVSKNELGQWEPRNPEKEELRCCSIYSEEALRRNAGKAKVHIVLGQVAAKALLKGEYRKGQNTFFSQKLNAWVVMTYHPSYFLRGAPRSKLADFREALRTAVKKAQMKVVSKFGYLDTMDYKYVALPSIRKEILEPAKAAKTRVVVDIEDGYDDEGNNVIVYVGFSWKPGNSRGVFLNHRQFRNIEDTPKKIALLRELLEDETIKKAFHHGVYDVAKIKKLLGITVKGFDHDTEYSEYLRFSDRYSYALGAIADIRFRDFAGYKTILDDYKDEETGNVNFWTVSPMVIVKYNGADCDLTKRIELDNDGKMSQGLLRVMILVAPRLAYMEDHGPLFDWEHSKLLDSWIPKKLDKLTRELQKIAGDENFNPNSPPQVKDIVYNKLKLGRYLDEEWKEENPGSTNKETMQLVGRYHKFPNLIVEWRALSKKKGTYMDGYRKSAELNNGRLRTKWWLTGTVTNRLRSGGERGNKKEAQKKGIVNLQNIHGAKEIECLLISDPRWKEMYRAWLKSGSSTGAPKK